MCNLNLNFLGFKNTIMIFLTRNNNEELGLLQAKGAARHSETSHSCDSKVCEKCGSVTPSPRLPPGAIPPLATGYSAICREEVKS